MRSALEREETLANLMVVTRPPPVLIPGHSQDCAKPTSSTTNTAARTPDATPRAAEKAYSVFAETETELPNPFIDADVFTGPFAEPADELTVPVFDEVDPEAVGAHKEISAVDRADEVGDVVSSAIHARVQTPEPQMPPIPGDASQGVPDRELEPDETDHQHSERPMDRTPLEPGTSETPSGAGAVASSDECQKDARPEDTSTHAADDHQMAAASENAVKKAKARGTKKSAPQLLADVAAGDESKPRRSSRCRHKSFKAEKMDPYVATKHREFS